MAARNLALYMAGRKTENQGEIPRGVYPERQSEILRFAQNDKRRARNDTTRYCGSADPRCWGPRFFRGATDKPRTPTPGVRAT
jgi:hypothetical protein